MAEPVLGLEGECDTVLSLLPGVGHGMELEQEA